MNQLRYSLFLILGILEIPGRDKFGLRLSVLYYHEARIRPVYTIFAHKNILLAAGYAIASPVGLLHLIAPISVIIIEKFEGVTIDSVRLVNVGALQHIEVGYA